MFTQCPKCHTVFRLSAQQLRMAKGLVRCGTCRTVFDCMHTLRDESPLGEDDPGTGTLEEDPSTAVLDLDRPAPEAQGRSDARSDPFLPGSRPAQADPGSAADATPTPAGREKPARPRSVGPLPGMHMESAARARRDDARSGDGPGFPGRLVLDDPVARLLREVEEEVKPRSRVGTLAWGFGVILLSALLVLQYAYFQRESLARRTELRPWLQSMCRVLACTLPAPRDPGAIRIVARELRVQPGLPDALRVHVSFVNGAAFAQAYPLLLVRLLRTDGSLLAGRAFRPEEYLREPPEPPGLLRPGAGAHAELILESPGLDASGFELELL